ncbi:unnamed protein product, partial [Prorocentrum cordatum]
MPRAGSERRAEGAWQRSVRPSSDGSQGARRRTAEKGRNRVKRAGTSSEVDETVQAREVKRTMAGCRVSAVFVNSCDSLGIATAFMEAGVPHVICCNGQIFDGACKIFTRGFYRSLGMGRSIYASFEHAREAVACSPQVGLRAEASKFQLLPRQEDLFYYQISLSSVSKHHLNDLRKLTTVKREDRIAMPDE